MDPGSHSGISYVTSYHTTMYWEKYKMTEQAVTELLYVPRAGKLLRQCRRQQRSRKQYCVTKIVEGELNVLDRMSKTPFLPHIRWEVNWTFFSIFVSTRIHCLERAGISFSFIVNIIIIIITIWRTKFISLSSSHILVLFYSLPMSLLLLILLPSYCFLNRITSATLASLHFFFLFYTSRREIWSLLSFLP